MRARCPLRSFSRTHHAPREGVERSWRAGSSGGGGCEVRSATLRSATLTAGSTHLTAARPSAARLAPPRHSAAAPSRRRPEPPPMRSSRAVRKSATVPLVPAARPPAPLPRHLPPPPRSTRWRARPARGPRRKRTRRSEGVGGGRRRARRRNAPKALQLPLPQQRRVRGARNFSRCSTQPASCPGAAPACARPATTTIGGRSHRQ